MNSVQTTIASALGLGKKYDETLPGNKIYEYLSNIESNITKTKLAILKQTWIKNYWLLANGWLAKRWRIVCELKKHIRKSVSLKWILHT